MRASLRHAAATALLALSSSCFDSDDQGVAETDTAIEWEDPLAEGETGDGGVSTGEETTPEIPEATCRDAIDCVQDCGFALINAELPEPDLTCFLECESGLTTEEALSVLRLSACVSDGCIADGDCDVDASDTDTDTDGVDDINTVCMTCIISAMLDPEPPGCMQQASECE